MSCLSYAQSPLEWAVSFGSDNHDHSFSIDVDNAGNVYSCGSFSGMMDADPGPGFFDLPSSGYTDAFVQKLDADGNFLWAHKLGGPANDEALSVINNGLGSVFVTGYFTGTASFFPSTTSPVLTSNGGKDIYILKLDTAGTILWAKSMGGTENDASTQLTADLWGNTYLSGDFGDTVDFNPSAGTDIKIAQGGRDIFIMKLDTGGNYLWTKTIGGPGDSQGYTLTTDGQGNIIATGHFSGTFDFDPGTGNHFLTSNGPSDIYIVKLNSAGDFITAKSIGGSMAGDIGASVKSDLNQNIIITGFFAGTADLDPGVNVFNATAMGMSDAFIIKFDSLLNFTWAKIFGGPLMEVCLSAIDENGNIYTNGQFTDTLYYESGMNQDFLLSNGTSDIFMCKLDPLGNLLWIKSMGGSSGDSGMDICMDNAGHLYMIGDYNGTVDFDPFVGGFPMTSNGSYDMYIQKFNSFYEVVTVCDSYTSSNGIVWSAPGLYADTLTNSLGGDSIVYVDLSIVSSSVSTINPSTCTSYISPSGNYIWSQSGTYHDTIQNSLGCDSIVTVNLLVNSSTYSEIYPVVCDSYISPSGNYNWSQPGVYNDTIQNASGCDSIITVNLSVAYSTTSVIYPVVCDSYLSPSGNFTWNQTGIYTDILQNAMGCDSIITVNLTVDHSTFYTIYPTVCEPYLSPSGSYVWSQSGLYTDTLISYLGCDSIISINLTVISIDTSVLIIGDSLFVIESPASYQWLDCNNNFAPIPVAYFQYFVPTISGSYAAQIYNGTCFDTTACVTIVLLSTPSILDIEEISLFPNPVNDEITIDFKNPISETQISVYNLTGQMVFSQVNFSGTNFNLNTKSYDAGIYFLKISNWENALHLKFVKE
ncbi:MAG: T9SS type A sorting domain-containing protein [Bacteroidales bacterium]|nr:T9SS type A sorting domain-containing protein [Bacteroidales bacterium]MCF8458432.1 T9SS type A sorting domain-containing protein [Bacteroidales bacterium]